MNILNNLADEEIIKCENIINMIGAVGDAEYIIKYGGFDKKHINKDEILHEMVGKNLSELKIDTRKFVCASSEIDREEDKPNGNIKTRKQSLDKYSIKKSINKHTTNTEEIAEKNNISRLKEKVVTQLKLTMFIIPSYVKKVFGSEIWIKLKREFTRKLLKVVDKENLKNFCYKIVLLPISFVTHILKQLIYMNLRGIKFLKKFNMIGIPNIDVIAGFFCLVTFVPAGVISCIIDLLDMNCSIKNFIQGGKNNLQLVLN